MAAAANQSEGVRIWVEYLRTDQVEREGCGEILGEVFEQSSIVGLPCGRGASAVVRGMGT